MQHCQYPSSVPCSAPAAYLITVRWESGIEFREAYCRPHVSRRADEISAEGGKVVAAKGLIEPPTVETLLLRPVGLDAVVPQRVELVR